MAVVVDPRRLDLHHRGDEGGEEHGLQVAAVQHVAILHIFLKRSAKDLAAIAPNFKSSPPRRNPSR